MYLGISTDLRNFSCVFKLLNFPVLGISTVMTCTTVYSWVKACASSRKYNQGVMTKSMLYYIAWKTCECCTSWNSSIYCISIADSQGHGSAGAWQRREEAVVVVVIPCARVYKRMYTLDCSTSVQGPKRPLGFWPQALAKPGDQRNVCGHDGISSKDSSKNELFTYRQDVWVEVVAPSWA